MPTMGRAEVIAFDGEKSRKLMHVAFDRSFTHRKTRSLELAAQLRGAFPRSAMRDDVIQQFPLAGDGVS
jgi:hypothetical protein